jgi:hypothetical protein
VGDYDTGRIREEWSFHNERYRADTVPERARRSKENSREDN